MKLTVREEKEEEKKVFVHRKFKKGCPILLQIIASNENVQLASISSTLNAQIFHTNVILAAFF